MTLTDKLKDVASKAGEKAQDLGEKGKGLAVKAGAKAQDVGELGLLLMEIRHLESQIDNLLGKLGAETYISLMEDEVEVTIEAPMVQGTLMELSEVKNVLDQKKAALRARGKV